MGCSVLTATRGRQLRAAVWLVCAAAALWVGCGRGPSAPAPPDLPGASGTVSVAGLASPVRVVRDRWGVPHISAANTPDLFFAQGFVQAQDRLFQMDLWRRSAQGRLAEVLGSNFVGRDAMTRRIQFHGAPDEEWARLGEETRTIATAFVQGINAWVALARQHPPEAFVLAGWQPDFWQPEDLLNRTDAFLASGGLSAEVFRARLVAAVGASRADALLGLPAGVPTGFDPRTVTFQLAESLKQIGAPPFFVGLRGPVAEAPPTGSGGSNAWALAGARTATGVPVVATDPHRALSAPSTRYLVHLSAPGWNVAGATAPWLPGVAIGHNDAVAWGMAASDIDTEDVSVERLNPGNSHQVEWRGAWTNTTVVLDRIWVKGRRPVTFEREYTPHGVVLAIDGERHLAFTLRWSGLEPGVGGELAALGLDRATSVADFRAALVRWQSPPVEVVVADTAGAVAADVAALVPMRRDADGRLPTVGWREAGRWEGWQPQATLPRSALPRSAEPAPGYVASANESVARLGRIRDVLARAHGHAVEDSWRLQQDVLAWNAVQLVPLLARVHARRPDVESARQELLAWDRRVSADSAAAAVYVVWEQEAKRLLAAGRAPADLADELAARSSHLFVASLTRPSSVWFDGDVVRSRDRLLLDALTAAADELATRRSPQGVAVAWGALHTTTFVHPLGVTDATRRRYSIGPFARSGYADTVLSTSGRGLEATVGASFSGVFDVGNWDASVVQNPPGQSESPASPHAADLAPLWAAGRPVPFVFGADAVRRNEESTLTLVPRSPVPLR